MLKKKLKKYLPDRKKLLENRSLRIFGNMIHDPNRWHLNRTSVARAFAVGLFFAWVPVPFQMALAVAGAIIFHANLPISVALVWLTNPLTMPVIFVFAYKIGTWILSTPPLPFKFNLSLEWLTSTVHDIWQPFLLGCFICGVVSSVVGYTAVRLIWRYFTVKSWLNRKSRQNGNI